MICCSSITRRSSSVELVLLTAKYSILSTVCIPTTASPCLPSRSIHLEGNIQRPNVANSRIYFLYVLLQLQTIHPIHLLRLRRAPPTFGQIVATGDIPLSRVKFTAKHEYEFLANFKVLQNVFKQHKVDKVRTLRP